LTPEKKQAGELLRPVVRLILQKLNFDNFLRLRAFIAHFDSEFNTLAFIKVLKPIGEDGTEMYKYISFATVAFDETIAFLAVEPFHRTGLFVSHDLELLSKI
jgi:hypothetical protein